MNWDDCYENVDAIVIVGVIVISSTITFSKVTIIKVNGN